MVMYYDLHIHSDLSPCGDREMTPNNILNMAKIKELDIISITDHNTVRNYPAFKIVADRLNIKVIPGIEITSKENVHLLAYFRCYDTAAFIGDLLYDSLPDIPNNPRIFGEQNLYDSSDEIIGSMKKLLINATTFTIQEIINMVESKNGIVVPAHVEKKADGILGVLGFIPKEYQFKFVEVYHDEYESPLIQGYKKLHNSDAHRLVDIREKTKYNQLHEMLFD